MEKYYFSPMSQNLNDTHLMVNKLSMLTEEEIYNKKIYYGVNNEKSVPLFTIDELSKVMEQHPKLVLYKSTVEAFISKEDDEYKLAMKLVNDNQ